MTKDAQGRVAGGFRRVGRIAQVAFAWVGVLVGSVLAGDDWLTSYEEAMEAARAEGKPVLTIFTGSDWCPHCRTLEEKVLHTETFREWSEGRLVLLMIDLPQQGISAEERAIRSRVCIKYGVRTFPSTVLIGPDGSRITAQTGYLGQSAEAWVASLDGHVPDREDAAAPVVAARDTPVRFTSETGRPRR